jgi:hypothetical protein
VKKRFLILFSVCYLFFPSTVSAQETIKNFDAKIEAHQNGEMTITETIKYDFGSNSRHGIFRFVPTFTKVGELFRVSDIQFLSVKRDGQKEKYQASYNAEVVEAKIGDPDKTIKFEHDYEIIYQVKNGIGSNYDDHDEIYWNITGNGWDIPIEKVNATITTDFGATPTKTICFTGPSGSRQSECLSKTDNISSLTSTTQTLENYEGLTVVTAFPVGTFPKSTLQDSAPVFGKDFKTFLAIYAIVWIVLNILVTALVWRWYQKHRNKLALGKPAVNFDIPKADGKVITPLEAGIIDNAKLEQNDVMATIFDLAIKKYIRLEQIEGKKTLGVFKGGDDYKMIRLKEFTSDSQLEEYEKILLTKLLSDQTESKLSEIKTFYQTFSRMEKNGFTTLVEKGFYTKNPQGEKAVFRVLGVVGLLSGQIILGPLLLFLSIKLNGRTKKGDQMDHQVEGLKIFLKKMTRHYNFQVKKAITVEKYIPYAMAFGFIDQFMDQIKEIYPDYNPSWYSGNNSFYAARMGMISSMSSHMTTSAPSSSSGFSGGGTSGGGGGGGGGGSW